MEQTQQSEATAKNVEKSMSQPLGPSAVLTNVSTAASSGSDSTSLQVSQKPAADAVGLKSTSEKDESSDAVQTTTADAPKPPSTSAPSAFSVSEKFPGTVCFFAEIE